MVKNSVIIDAHPDERSFSSALAKELAAETEAAGGRAEIVRLYDAGFNPVLSLDEMQRRFSFDEDVQEQQNLIQNAQVIIWIHPDWWGGLPALLKGWIDRVLASGFAFSFEEQEDGTVRRVPLLKGKAALAVVTSDADASEPVPAVDIWQKRVFAYTGLNPAEVLLFPEVRSSDFPVRKEFIQICRETLRGIIASSPGQAE